MKINSHSFNFSNVNNQLNSDANKNSIKKNEQNFIGMHKDTISISPEAKANFLVQSLNKQKDEDDLNAKLTSLDEQIASANESVTKTEDLSTYSMQSRAVSTTSVTAESTGTSAADFKNTYEYNKYLEDTYSSIKDNNIKISNTVLQQAMSDPEKEKVLIQFLEEDAYAARAYQESKIQGLNDDTYSYKLDNYTIYLDSISDDNSGIDGRDFSEITVQRNDGQYITDDEFENLKKDVSDLFLEIEEQKQQRAKDLFKSLESLNDVDRAEARAEAREKAKAEAKNEAEKQAEEKLNEKLAAAREDKAYDKEALLNTDDESVNIFSN